MPPLVLELRARAGEFKSEMKAAQAEVNKTAKTSEEGGSRISSSFNRAATAGKVITFAGVAAAGAIAAYSIKAADAADVSNANLTAALHGAGTSFDAQRRQIAATDAQMTKFGFTNAQTNQSLAQLTVGLQDPAKAMGVMSTAANLARFRHIDLASASQLVLKAMEGQTRPLKQLGIDLPVAAGGAQKLKQAQESLKQQTMIYRAELDKYNSTSHHTTAETLELHAAHQKLLYTQGQVASAQQAGATILDALNKRLGTAATAYGDTLPGKIAVAHAQFQNLSATLGQKLEPILISVAGEAASLASTILRNKPVLIAVATVIGTIVVGAITAYVISLGRAAAAQIKWAAQGAKSAAQWVASQVSSLAEATAAGATWVAEQAAQAGEWIAARAVQVAEFVAQNAIMIGGYIATAAAATAAFVAENAASLGIVAGIGLLVAAAVYVATHWRQVWGDIKRVVTDAVGFVRQHLMVFGTILAVALLGPVGIAAALLVTHWRQVWSVIGSVVRTAVSVVTGIVHGLVDAWTVEFNIIRDVTSAVFDGIRSAVTDGIGAVRSIVSDALGFISNLWNSKFNLMRDEITVVFTVVKDVVNAAVTTVRTIIDAVLEAIHGHWAQAWGTLKDLASNALNGAVNAIMGLVHQFPTLLTQAGKDIVNGLVNGITSMASAPLDAIKHIASGVLGAAKHVLKIFSPSQEFHELGLNITRGWTNGITAGTPAVISAVKSAAAKVLSTAQATLKSLQSKSDQLASSTTASYLSAADVTGATGTGANGALTSQDVLSNLANQANALSTYRSQLAALRKEGLNAALYKQLVAAGVSGGSGTATALLAGGKTAIAQADKYSQSISSSATSLGKDVAAAEYGKQIAKALKTELKDTKLVAAVDVYLDGQKLQASAVKHSQRRKSRNGTTGLT